MIYIKSFDSVEDGTGYETFIPFIGGIIGSKRCIYGNKSQKELYNILEKTDDEYFLKYDGGWYMYYDSDGRHPVLYSNTTMPSFSQNKNIKKIVIGDELTTIQSYGFQNCTGLTSVILPESIKTIGDQCFEGCTSLRSITIPKSVISIGTKLQFQGDYNLEKIIVESGNTVYDSRDNCNCIIITKENSILAGCKGCSVIPEGVVTTQYGAFMGHSGLKSITLPSTMKSIEGRCFYGCSSLTGITFPESMTSIGYESLGACYAIKDINIPKNVSNIGDYPCAGCNSLTSITVDEENKWFDSRENCNAIIRTSDGYLVQGCKTTIIPEGVKNIGKVAFRTTGLSNGIKMPSTINYITEMAFMWCGDLGNLDFSLVTSIPTLEDVSAFNGTPNTMKIIVPDNLYDDWIIASNWSSYASRIIKASEYNL